MNLAKSKLVAFHSMKVLACFLCFLCFLLSLGIISLTHAAEELFWTPVLLSEPITFGVARFKGELGWMNTGKQLWITHDSGRNWRISLTGPLRDIYFVDDLEGWAIADRNVLFHTSDGGTTWQTMEFEFIRTSTELLLEGLLVSIYFKDSLPEGLRQMIEFLQTHPEYGAIGIPKQEFLHRSEEDMLHSEHVDMSCVLFRREVLEKLTFCFPQTEGYHPGGSCECSQACRDIRAMGLEIGFLPHLLAQHIYST